MWVELDLLLAVVARHARPLRYASEEVILENTPLSTAKLWEA